MLTWLLGTAAYDWSSCCFSHFRVETEEPTASHVTSPLCPCSTSIDLFSFKTKCLVGNWAANKFHKKMYLRCSLQWVVTTQFTPSNWLQRLKQKCLYIPTYFKSKVIFVNGILQFLLGRISYPTLQPALHSKRNNGKLSDCHKASV